MKAQKGMFIASLARAMWEDLASCERSDEVCIEGAPGAGASMPRGQIEREQGGV